MFLEEGGNIMCMGANWANMGSMQDEKATCEI